MVTILTKYHHQLSINERLVFWRAFIIIFDPCPEDKFIHSNFFIVPIFCLNVEKRCSTGEYYVEYEDIKYISSKFPLIVFKTAEFLRIAALSKTKTFFIVDLVYFSLINLLKSLIKSSNSFEFMLCL